MKKILYTALSLVLFATSCTDNSLEDQGIELSEELGKYVAFSVSGVVTSIDDIDIREDGGDTSSDINVEIPGGTVSNVTVNYTFGGTAVFGTDFTIDGATASGGSVVIETQSTPIDDGLPLNADIKVVALTDGVVDGSKTLELNLASASNDEGEILVGRAGLDVLKTVSVNFVDSDYVAFDSSSQTVNESDDDVSVTIEAYPGDQRDGNVTVEYSLSGTAVFGTDYTIVGATATGGTATITPNVADAGDPSTLDLEIVMIDNSEVSAADADPKEIIITLDSASDAKEPNLVIGDGGDLNEYTITINDDDADYVALAESSIPKEVAENDGTIKLILEAYPGPQRTENVTVNYTLGGTAVLGTDYTIAGATDAGGTLTITPNADANNLTGASTLEVDIVLLTDDAADGDKTIIFTITGASEASTPELPIGVNGTDTLRSATITVKDID